MDIKQKMNPTELNNKLHRAMNSSDFIDEARSIAETLKNEGAGIEFVRAILKFMEEHPTHDFGTPGPLAHFVETFYGHGYEAELFASINRRPTSHTIWLLNRIINGTKEPAERTKLIKMLREAEINPAADLQAKRSAAHFLERIS
jgi:hypothetical protein